MSDLSVKAQKSALPTEEKVTDKKQEIKLDEEKAIGGKKGKHLLRKAGKKLAQPVVDQFHKDYGEDAVATPKTVADFAFDHGVKIAIAALTIGVTFAVTRGKFSGFSKNFAQNLKTSGPIKAAKEAISQVKVANAKAVLDANNLKKGAQSAEGLKDALGEVADEVAENVTGKTGILNSVKRIFTGTPKTEFVEGSKIPQFVDRVAGKNADKVKTTILNAGIAEGADAIDLGLTVGATALATKGTNKVASDAVDKNDASLGFESKLDTIQKGLELIEQIAG